MVARPQDTHKGSSAPTLRLRSGPQLLFVDREQKLSEQINTVCRCRGEQASQESTGAKLALWLFRTHAGTAPYFHRRTRSHHTKLSLSAWAPEQIPKTKLSVSRSTWTARCSATMKRFLTFESTLSLHVTTIHHASHVDVKTYTSGQKLQTALAKYEYRAQGKMLIT